MYFLQKVFLFAIEITSLISIGLFFKGFRIVCTRRAGAAIRQAPKREIEKSGKNPYD
jgi:hypothetical protein